jgi:hypothetical protein
LGAVETPKEETEGALGGACDWFNSPKTEFANNPMLKLPKLARSGKEERGGVQMRQKE